MATTSADAASSQDSGTPILNLQIISPSVAVPRPLSFQLPVETTVQQLKERIRNSIDAKPADQAQRLIHRGRLLSRDDETLLSIFGENTIRSAEPQTLHLVLRDLSEARPATTSTSTNSAPPANATQNQAPSALHGQPMQQPTVRNLNPHAPFPHVSMPHVHTGHQPHNLPFGFQQAPIGATLPGQPANISFGYGTPHQIAVAQQMAQQQQHLAQHQRGIWMNNMADPQRLQEIINQSQRDRAAMGLNGAGDGQHGSAGVPGTQLPGRNASPQRPDGTRTVVREGHGPGGQSWRITVNETVTTQANPQRNLGTGSPFAPPEIQNLFRPPGGAPQPPRSVPLAGPHGGQLSGTEVQNIIQAADAGQAATRLMTDAMRRNASSSSLASHGNNQSTQPIPPGVTTPLVPSRTASAMGTPAPLGPHPNAHQHPASQPPTGPEVYILSSPEGPRALLMSSDLGTYVTPLNLQPQIPNDALRFVVNPRPLGQFNTLPGARVGPQIFQGQQQQGLPVGSPWAPPPGDPFAQHNHQHQQAQAQPALAAQGLPPLPNAQPQIGHAVAQPANVQVRAIAVAQIWPHIWMVLRLMLFIWWFTSPNASWQRWFTVLAIAVSLFLVNTGVLTPLAEQFWTPIRRHLENLMPAADDHGRERPARAGNAQAGNGEAATGGARRAPDPAETAARLVRERRAANGNWLMAQARRLERAGILFLASIAPGVAERHIAHLEAEARAERERQEAAEAAAAEAARLAAESAQNAQDTNGDGSGPAAPGPATDEANVGPENAEQPLLAA